MLICIRLAALKKKVLKKYTVEMCFFGVRVRFSQFKLGILGIYFQKLIDLYKTVLFFM